VNRLLILRNKKFNALADQFSAGIAEHGFRGRVCQSDAAVGGNFQDCIRRGFQQLAKPVLYATRRRGRFDGKTHFRIGSGSRHGT
jgi:hypothetical protein